MNIRRANDRQGSCPGGGGAVILVCKTGGETYRRACVRLPIKYVNLLIENIHSLTMRIFKEKKRNTFHNQTLCVFRYNPKD